MKTLPSVNFISHSEINDNAITNTIIDKSFGPGRYTKTAYRLREYSQEITQLSYYIITDHKKIIGTIQYWPILIGNKWDALLLGPLAILPHHQNQGYGMKLMEYTLIKAANLHHKRVLLVGDIQYYNRAGFTKASHILMPGPVDYNRLLVKELTTNAMQNVSGLCSANFNFSQ